MADDEIEILKGRLVTDEYVRDLMDISQSSLERLRECEDDFPQRVSVGKRAKRYKLYQVLAWIETRQK